MAVLLTHAAQAAAQMPGIVLGLGPTITAGGEQDNYLRYLQTLGQAKYAPWGLRNLTPRLTARARTVVGAHPWRDSGLFPATTAARAITWLPVNLTARFNSAYPWGGNDGAVWAGRGVTAAISGGLAIARGPLTVTLDPLLFVAANRAFPLIPVDQTDASPFGNPDFAYQIDRPQRFGSGTYSRIDPGQSSIVLDLGSAAIGLSTANEWWGPASTYPVVLGNNAPGIPHVFLGTGAPVRIGFGTLQARLEYGLESQSPYSPVRGAPTFVDVSSPGRIRFMSGLVGTLTLDAIPGLEIGATRFFHEAWRGRVGVAELTAPFEGLVKASLPRGPRISGIGTRDALKNQLASVFARWALVKSGFEVYFEYGHEDHNFDTRDLVSEPDHSRAATLGLRKVFRADSTHFVGLRVEVFDGTAPTLHRHRGEGLLYIHNPLRQGHTEDGQLLGSNAGVGSPAAAIIALDGYGPRGRTTIFAAKQSENNFPPYQTTGVPDLAPSEQAASVGVERVQFTAHGEIWISASGVYQGGLRYQNAQHGLNINLQIGVSLFSPRRSLRQRRALRTDFRPSERP